MVVQFLQIFWPLKIFYGPKARLNYIEEVYRLLKSKHFKNERNQNIFRYLFNFYKIWELFGPIKIFFDLISIPNYIVKKKGVL